MRLLARKFGKTPADGAKTTLYVALSDELENASDNYYASEKLAKLKPYAFDDDASLMLWELSEELCDWYWGGEPRKKHKKNKRQPKQKD
jgi:hypothetical protein